MYKVQTSSLTLFSFFTYNYYTTAVTTGLLPMLLLLLQTYFNHQNRMRTLYVTYVIQVRSSMYKEIKKGLMLNLQENWRLLRIFNAKIFSTSAIQLIYVLNGVNERNTILASKSHKST